MKMSLSALPRCLAGAIAGAIACGCSTSGSSPFGSASSVELTFVGAAQTWDTNKDNSVTCAEWKAYTVELFQSADKNRDGAVDAEEYSHVTKQDKLFEITGMPFFDANGDSRLTQAELSDRENPAFRVLDKDKDCTLGTMELVQTRGPTAKAKETYGEAPDIPKR